MFVKNMDMNNNQILEDLYIIRNLAKTTKREYKKVIKSYTSFRELSLQELLDEAETEEKNGIRWKKRKIMQRFIDYRLYLVQKYSKKTVKNYFNVVERIYRHYEIELHPLPLLNDKAMRDYPPIPFEDLPDKKLIKVILKIASPFLRAVVLLMSSSGCGRVEILNFTVQDFIDATKDYHDSNNIYEVVDCLKYKNDIVLCLKSEDKKQLNITSLSALLRQQLL